MSDHNFQIAVGVHCIGDPESTQQATRFNLITKEPEGQARAWDAVPENDLQDETVHWRHAGKLTNELLIEHLTALQDRCSDEFLGNPTVEGVIAKHAVDMVGDEGPTLQVETVDWPDQDAAKQYVEEAEKLWREVADAPTADGEESWAEWIGSALTEDWLSGGTVDQIVHDPDVDHPIKTRLHPIEIRRLQTPPEMASDPDTILGITRNRFGRPKQYHFMEDWDGFGFAADWMNPIQSTDIIHGFLRRRRGLVRGYPMLSGTLATAAAIRDLDRNIIDLVQTAAMMNVFAYTTSDLVDPWDASKVENTPIRLHRRGIPRVPPHFQLDSVQSKQPTPEYQALRRERSADIGRPAAIPGLAVHMDASGHNYSSARFDDRGYWRANGRWQGYTARKRMNPYVHRVLQEAEDLKLIPRRRGRVVLKWQWPKSDGIDPLKDALSRKQRMHNLSASPYAIAAEEGNDLSQNIRDAARFYDELRAVNLPDPLIESIVSSIFTGKIDAATEAVANEPEVPVNDD